MKSNIKVPNIKNGQIMDKCVLKNFANELKKDLKFSDELLEKSKVMLKEIENNIQNSTVVIDTFNNKINNDNLNYAYIEDFKNVTGIDMNSDCHVDLIKNIAGLDIIALEKVDFDKCYLNDVLNPNLLVSSLEKTNNLKGDSFLIRATFSKEEFINNIVLDFSTVDDIEYYMYSDDENLIQFGKANRKISVSFDIRKVNEVSIILKSTKVVDININNIYASREFYKTVGEIKTKPFNLYKTINNINVLCDSNNKSKVRKYIGFYDKEDNINWYNADNKITFDLSNSFARLVNKESEGFGDEIKELNSIFTLSRNTNNNSIKVYDGYGLYRVTTIENAFMSNDLANIEYAPRDIKERTYKDVDDYYFNIRAGELKIYEQTIVCDKEFDVTMPLPKAIREIIEEEVEEVIKQLPYGIPTGLTRKALCQFTDKEGNEVFYEFDNFKAMEPKKEVVEEIEKPKEGETEEPAPEEPKEKEGAGYIYGKLGVVKYHLQTKTNDKNEEEKVWVKENKLYLGDVLIDPDKTKDIYTSNEDMKIVCNDLGYTVHATDGPIKLPPVEPIDYTKFFRYKIVLNGERIDNNFSLDETVSYKLKKGINKLQIVFNVKKTKEEDSYLIEAANFINNRKYSDRIFYKELKPATLTKTKNDLNNNYFSITNNKIVVNGIDENVNYLIAYDTIVDSNIHFEDYRGQYLKAVIKLVLNSSNNYNNTYVSKIYIK